MIDMNWIRIMAIHLKEENYNNENDRNLIKMLVSYLNTSRKDGSHIRLEQALRNTLLRPAMLLTPY
jgi:flagellar motor component MotA